MRKTKKTELGQNSVNSKLFYAALALIPSLQFIIFYIVVNFNSFVLAFKDFSATGLEYTWTFDNFSGWFTNELKNTELWTSIGVSLKSYGIMLLVSIPLGLFFSYYMFKKMPASGLFRVLLFLPSILSAAVLAVIYKNMSEWALGGTAGVISKLLGETFRFWDKEHRYVSMIIFCIFFSFGTNVLMYTNKMNAISPEIIESAHLDGANGIKEFWYIVLPQTYSIVQVFLINGFASVCINQYNSHMLFGYSGMAADVKPIGYLLWSGVQRAKGDVALMTEYAALGLMLTLIVVPLTFLLRWALDKFGWSED